jgi:D-3-phosphoglycerate dehydrogenase
MMALAKRLPALNRVMQSDGWAWPEAQWLARDIAGSTIGLIGLGKIGSSMARMAGAGFRARVLAYSPHTPQERFDALGITRCHDLHEMLGQCDYVSVHSVLTPETHHLIGEAELRAMQAHACLINVSRGAIVDEQALIRALDQAWIAGAALDVYSQEPLALHDHPLSALFGRDNVILSPHLTFYTHEAMKRLEQETLQRCTEILEGRDVIIKSSDHRLAGQGNGVRYTSV